MAFIKAKRLMAVLHRQVYSTRLRVLSDCILPHLSERERVLDVGCGTGLLGRTLLDSPLCPRAVEVKGIERTKRGGEPIDVISYDGKTIPFPDNAFDVIILADVLHHETEPNRLLEECIRVARRLVIIKDHQRKGPLAQTRLSLIDWAANAPYGMECLYRYYTPEQWTELRTRYGLTLIEEHTSIRLYPKGFNLLFGRSLQYLAVLAVPKH